MSSFLASSWSIVAWVGLVVAIVHIARAHHATRGRSRTDALAWAWRAIALVGFAITWTFMIRMALQDIARFPDLYTWARASNLFFDAYRRVTSTAPAWWWSQQLMGWALGGVLWFSVEGRRHGMRFWAYPWLAMCVAVSVALPIFAQRLRTEGVVNPRAAVPRGVAVGVGIAAIALVVAPYAADSSFVIAMLVLHGALLVPAIATPRSPEIGRTVSVRRAAAFVALVCLGLHLAATFRLAATPARALLDVVAADPAQASISSDVVLSWLACALFVATTRGRARALAFAAAAPLVSLGAAFVWAVLWAEPIGERSEAPAHALAPRPDSRTL